MGIRERGRYFNVNGMTSLSRIAIVLGICTLISNRFVCFRNVLVVQAQPRDIYLVVFVCVVKAALYNLADNRSGISVSCWDHACLKKGPTPTSGPSRNVLNDPTNQSTTQSLLKENTYL
jgi:hypothetical protein